MTEKNKDERKRNLGRRPKMDPAVHRYGIKLNARENDEFRLLLSRAGMTQCSAFIKARIFGTPLKVVKIDKAAMDYYMRLTNLYHQFQAIGNNYNQTVRAIKTNFGEKRAFAMLQKLEKCTLDLIIISKEVIELTDLFEKKWLQK